MEVQLSLFTLLDMCSLRGMGPNCQSCFVGDKAATGRRMLLCASTDCRECVVWIGASSSVQVPRDLALDGIGASYEQTLDFTDRYPPMQRHHQSLPLNSLQVMAVLPCITALHE